MGVPVLRGLVVACAGAVLAVTGVAGSPAVADVSLPVAQERFDRAEQAYVRVEQRRNARQATQAAAQDRLTAARSRLAAAQHAYDTGVAATARSATAARRATLAKAAADARAEQTAAALRRMARAAYMHTSTGGELAVMVWAAVGGPRSLAGYSAGSLAVDRIQARVMTEADAASADAATTEAAYTGATAVHADAMQALGDAQADLFAARQDVRAATADVQLATQSAHRARLAAGRAGAAVSSARATLRRARASAAKRAARTSAPLPVPVDSPASEGNQAVLVWRILRANGFSEEAAAGILGNLQQESNIDPTTVQFDGPGMGLAQWSRGGRWDTGPNSLLAYAAAAGLDPWDARTQTRFMIVEMSAGWGGFDIDTFRQRTDVVAAAVYFHDVYEVSADTPEQVRAVRGGYALQWYAALAG